ncbi:unnamed protein product [marine sediment metagenome]|uniref:Uncharacterized protein n=1 Tax=marine sediment metagenome TaxID=412755 RepID=X0Z736_9ZZZZ
MNQMVKHIGGLVGVIGWLYMGYQEWKVNKVEGVVRTMFGYSIKHKTFLLKDAQGLMILGAGLGLSYAASKIGVNRYTPKGLNL